MILFSFFLSDAFHIVRILWLILGSGIYFYLNVT